MVQDTVRGTRRAYNGTLFGRRVGNPGSRHFQTMINQHHANWTGLACLLAISCALFLQNLSTPYITLWDEAVHVNVIKNLAEHCCLPQLHRSANIGTDYRRWTNNSLWLHKPLLPFYVTAGIYKLLGGSLWALRLPGAIFALLTAVVIYFIGRNFLNDHIGLCGAAIFCLNPYTNQLVHGKEFSGFSDLAFAFFVSVALYLILEWTQNRSTATLRLLGLVLGLGYMCKGGLAFAPFAVLVGVAILTGSIRDLIPALLQSIVVFGVVVLPERLHWLAHHPVEFRYEQQRQLLHLFTEIEHWRAPWYAYFTQYLPSMLGAPLVPFAYFSIGWALTQFRPGMPAYTLSIWTLAYLVPLSFGVSKIENFIFAVLPALALLVPSVVERLMYSRRFRLVFSLCVASLAAFVISRATEGSVIWSFMRAPGFEHPHRLTFLVVSAILAVALAVLFLIRFESRTVTTGVLVLTSVTLFSLYVGKDIFANGSEPKDSSEQAALRQTGSDLQPLVDKNGLILAHSNTLKLAYLYLMYWSGADVLDLCREPEPSKTVARFRERKNIYLITDKVLPTVPLATLPTGNLYSLREIPFEVWGPVASGVCQSESQDDDVPGR
jgi:4-amino-4-deoxy-L-arabinose transferase-like glycosyltransferase